MTPDNTEARAQFVDLAEWLAGWSWPIDQEEAKNIPEEHGWPLLFEKATGGGVYDTGLVEDRPWASFRLMDGMLSDVSITTLASPWTIPTGSGYSLIPSPIRWRLSPRCSARPASGRRAPRAVLCGTCRMGRCWTSDGSKANRLGASLARRTPR